MLLTIVSFVGFTGLVLGLSYYLTRKNDSSSQEGYFLAGRGLTGWIIAASLLLTNLSTEQMVGLNGQGYMFNMSGMGFEIGASLALIIVAFFFLPRYLKKGYATIPDFIGERYDAVTKQFVNFLFLAGYVLILLPVVLYSGAIGMGGIFDIMGVFNVDYMTAIIIVVVAIGVLGVVYSLAGGLRIMAVADTLNGIGLIIGGLMIPVFALMYVGGGDMLGGLKTVIEAHPEKFNAIGGPNDPVPFLTMFTGMFLVNLFYWGCNQTIIQRALAAKNLKEGQKGLLLAAVFKLIGPIYLIIPGIVAFHIFQDNPLQIGDMAYPMLVNKVLPFYLTGFFAAVLFGAILSSFNAALNSTSTLFMLNIYKPYIKPDATDKQVVFAGKVVAVILAVFSMCVAPLIAKAPSGLFNYLQMVNGFYNVPIFTLIIFGMLNKRAPAWAAKVTLVCFIIAYGLTQIPFAGKEAIPLLGWLSGIHYLHVMAILFVIAVAFMWLTGIYWPTKNNTYDDAKDLHVVDTTPWNKAVVMSVAIVLCVFAVYVIFSKFGIAA
ncbi:MAG TPA: solute:sodium symporter family transporter [Candidatus Avelusimicrobium excrementipullorum]|nr:solute:sodium symporter family transporter [Candidatus Avelusimicrobium excrementipullorum]